ncbi:beta strand repeat-containing protein, partial [Spiribacter roseus]|uniref:beta strand repeat-containing protein n=1 Tax=Spiribacter roseus TaxID=1855875 RepID=UPI00190F6CD8
RLSATAAQIDALTTLNADATGNVDVTALGNNAVDLTVVDTGNAGTATIDGNDVTLNSNTQLGDFAVELTNGQSLTVVTASQLSDSATAGREILTSGDGTGTAVGLNFATATSSMSVDAANWSADLGGVNFVNTNTQALTLNNLSVDSGTALDFSNLSDGSATVGMSDGNNALAYTYDASGDTITYDVAASGDAWDASNLPELNLAGAASGYDYSVTGAGTLTLGGDEAVVFTTNGQRLDATGLSGALTATLEASGGTSDTYSVDLGEGSTYDLTASSSETSGNYNLNLTEGGNYAGTLAGFGTNDSLTITGATVDVTNLNSGTDLGGLETIELGTNDLSATAAQIDALTTLNAETAGNVDVTALGNSAVDLTVVDTGNAGTATIDGDDVTLNSNT